MKHEAQGFERYVLGKTYLIDEEVYLKTVKPIFRFDVPLYANVVNHHVLYKVKQNDDGSLKLKAQTAPHRNEDDLKDALTKDCTICSPTALRILESIASVYSRKIYKSDVKGTFVQTGEAHGQVFVKPPQESNMRKTHLCLLLTDAYGLVHANAKRKV